MNHILKSQVQQAVSIIKNGGIVAFPTETVYGLGANVFDKKAIQKIFDTKNRPADNPLIVHISSLEMLNQLTAYISPENQKLIDAFWPGPLGIVFPKSEFVPDIVTAGLDTVVIRFPSHPIAQYFISECNIPIAAPSVNPSGKPSSTHHNPDVFRSSFLSSFVNLIIQQYMTFLKKLQFFNLVALNHCF
jgi:L-threonylcarbamoyladenylate synthase